jgi:predicted Rossmann fold nucleotide-binding protein DprA/Smf involved in DNA uptake
MATLGARVDDTFYKDTSAAAAKAGVKVSDYVKQAIQEKLSRNCDDKRQIPLLKNQEPKNTAKHRETIFKMLCEKPATKFELAARLGWDEHWVSPRLTELKKAGRIEPVGRRVNPASGASCSIWKITEEA